MQFEFQHTIPVSKGSNITGTGWTILSDLNINSGFSDVKIFFQTNCVGNIQHLKRLRNVHLKESVIFPGFSLFSTRKVRDFGKIIDTALQNYVRAPADGIRSDGSV